MKMANLARQATFLEKKQDKWAQMRLQYSCEQWFIQAAKREGKKDEDQRRKDRGLFDAVSKNNKTKAIQWIRKGATNDYEDEFGWSALLRSCYYGLTEVVRAILSKYPYEVERKSMHDHQSPLSIAFQKGNFDICKMFIIRGVKNPVLQWIQAAGRTSIIIDQGLKLIKEQGNFEKTIRKDLDRISEPKMVNDKHIRDGLHKLIAYLKPEMDEFIDQFFREKWAQKKGGNAK